MSAKSARGGEAGAGGVGAGGTLALELGYVVSSADRPGAVRLARTAVEKP